MFKRFLIGAVVALCATLASAQTGAYATFTYETWTFAPIVSSGAIKGYLAWADPATLTGDNLPIIYYQRTTTGWKMWGWADYDLGAATRYLHNTFGESVFQYDPDLVNVETATTVAQSPKELQYGVFVDDPVHVLIANAPDPVELVSLLVDLGWKAAPGLSQLAVADSILCPVDSTPADPVATLLNERTHDMDMIIFGSSTITLPCTYWPCGGCVTTYGTSTPSGPWTYRGSVVVDNLTVCKYDRDATQSWSRTGRSTWLCLDCTGSGTRNTVIRGIVAVPIGQACHPPS